MRFSVTILLIFLQFSFFGQEKNEASFFLSYNNKKILSDDFIDVYELNKIEIKPKIDTVDYEVQFVIIPFQGTILSFSKKQEEIKSMNIDELLGYANISIDKIRNIFLNLRKDEMSPTLYSANVFTRDLRNASDFFNEFVLYADAGEVESSAWYIYTAISMDSTNLTYLNAGAQFYFEIGELKLAQDAFLKISESNPNYTSFAYLSNISAKQGDYLNAKSYAKKSLPYASSNLEKSNVYLNIADADNKLLEYKAAYSSYKKSIELNPKNINALNNITTVLDEVKRSDEKVTYFNQIIAIDSSFYIVHINIGFHYLENQKFDKALEEFNAVLKIDPNQAIALSNKAFVLMKLGNLADALVTIEKSLQLEPTNSYGFKNKALILMEMGDVNSACIALNEALKLNFTQQYGEEVLGLIKKNCSN